MLQAEVCFPCLPPGFPAVSPYFSHTSFPDNLQASRSKTQNVPCVDAGFIKHAPAWREGLCCHACLCGSARRQVPARPGRTTPRIRFLFACLCVRTQTGRPASLDWASSRPRLATTPLPFSLPSAPRIPGPRTSTPEVVRHARHTRHDEPRL